MLDRKAIVLGLGGAALMVLGGCDSASDQDEPIEMGPMEDAEAVQAEAEANAAGDGAEEYGDEYSEEASEESSSPGDDDEEWAGGE